MTHLFANPVPRDFSVESIELLKNLVETEDDALLTARPVNFLLLRKWNSYAFYFFFVQFTIFVGLLSTLIAYSVVTEVDTRLAFGIAAFSINTYFFLYEIIQILIQRRAYISEFMNIIDVVRIGLIFWFIIATQFGTKVDYGICEEGDACWVKDKEGEQANRPWSYGIPQEVIPATFFLLWIKIFKFLQAFSAFRYIIMMIQEIIKSIGTFLALLFIAMLAYGQIMLTMKPVEDGATWAELRGGYVLALGELGSFDEYNFIQFFMFCMFTFFIPLTLMNMLIAIMSDTYARVQEGAASADARSLAEMELEMEEMTRFFFLVIRPSKVESEYQYSFYTKEMTKEDQTEEPPATKVDAVATVEQFNDKWVKLTELVTKLEEKADAAPVAAAAAEDEAAEEEGEEED